MLVATKEKNAISFFFFFCHGTPYTITFNPLHKGIADEGDHGMGFDPLVIWIGLQLLCINSQAWLSHTDNVLLFNTISYLGRVSDSVGVHMCVCVCVSSDSCSLIDLSC